MSHDLAPVLGAIHYERDFDINDILRTVVKSLQVKGVKVGGVLQESEFRPNRYCAQLNIVDIRTGETERITQDRGRIRAAASSTHAVSRRSLIASRMRSMPT